VTEKRTLFSSLFPLVSAGFDAADGDDLGECHVTPLGYAHMTHMLCGLKEQSKYWKGLDPKACDPIEGETFEPT
jgi:hypothetical protein